MPTISIQEILRSSLPIGFTGSKGDLGYTGSQGAGFTGSRGDTGFTGSHGERGGIRYNFSTTTTDSDPGQGVVRFNNATIGSVTNIYIDNTDINGNSITTWLDSFDDASNNYKGTITFLANVSGDATICLFSVSGTVVDGTGYRKITVSYIAGTLPSNAEELIVVFSRAGDLGYTGSQGDQGTTGFTGSKGDTGFTGSQGDTGSIGFTGSKGDTGTTGFTGSQGDKGGIRYNFSTTTTDSDPGTGTVRFNNATIGSVTNIYIDNVDVNSNDFTSWLDSFDDASNGHKGIIGFISNVAGDTTVAYFNVTGTIVDGTGYRKIPVTYISGSLPSNSETLVVVFSRTGDLGYTGSQGDQGTTGFTGSQGATGFTGSQGAGATPAGSDTHVQFNDGGSAFGGTAGFTFTKTTNNVVIANTLTIGGSVVNTTTFAVGANIFLSTTTLSVGNSTANLLANSILVKVANSTGTANLQPTQLVIGGSTVNSTAHVAGANVFLSTTTLSIGNSTANLLANSILVKVANSTGTANLQPTQLVIGISTVNTTAMSIGANIIVNSSVISVGNSTANAIIDNIEILITGPGGQLNLTSTAVGIGSNVNLTMSTLSIGNSTVNTLANSTFVKIANSTTGANLTSSQLKLGANVFLSTTTLSMGNSTVNTLANSLGYYVNGIRLITPLSVLDATGGVTSLDETTKITSAFNRYLIVLEDIVPQTNNVSFNIRTSDDGGSAYDTSAYSWTDHVTFYNSVTNAEALWSNNSAGSISGEIWFSNPNGSLNKIFNGLIGGKAASAGAWRTFGIGGDYWGGANTVNAIRFMFSSGNIASGKIRIYGVA